MLEEVLNTVSKLSAREGFGLLRGLRPLRRTARRRQYKRREGEREDPTTTVGSRWGPGEC